jgi:DNA-binding transcriptional LysR family regulator
MYSGELHLADLSTFLAVVRAGSISSAARGLVVTPSQVSKAVARLEKRFGAHLLQRSARGVRVSDAGQSLALQFEALLERANSLGVGRGRSELTLVASAFLNAFFVPELTAALPELRLHVIDQPPGTAAVDASTPLFDVALTTRGERFPGSWFRERVGWIRRALFASPDLAKRLGPRPAIEELRATPFIGPIYGFRDQVVLGDDACPLPARERRFEQRTQTVALALDLAATTHHLVFAPTISAREQVARGRLVEISVGGWNVREPLWLICHEERVLKREQRALRTTLRALARR